MEEDLIAIEQSARREKIINFLKKNRLKFYFLFAILIICFGSIFFYFDYKKKHKLKLSDQYIQAEIYLESAFKNTPFKPKKRLPVAKQLGETSLVFLVHPTLNNKDINLITNAMHEVFNKASRN